LSRYIRQTMRALFILFSLVVFTSVQSQTLEESELELKKLETQLKELERENRVLEMDKRKLENSPDKYPKLDYY
jgi:archaellum component FlaC